MARYELHNGDSLEMLKAMPDGSVGCIVTSPPYWNLRDYCVDGQIGLEPTPAEYVARMVAVFREARRVLADDGCCFVNLGDSYASSPASGGEQSDRMTGGEHKRTPNSGYRRPAGLKPKDLVGIPWRVAFALQQPYYSGRIKDERDRVWLAAMIDAEGCMFIHKRKVGQNNGQGYSRKNDSYAPGLEISNTHRSVVERCMEITGLGSICSQSPEQNPGRKQTIYRWNLRTTECRDIVREVYPHLVAKRQQARILCGCPSSGASAEAAHAALIGLHRGAQTDIDFAAPASMFENGWYLRQDLIWAKKNPMPESVRDRCTKAHEYIFLLTKSERYWWDGDAIAEEAAGPLKACGPKNDASRNDSGTTQTTRGDGITRNRRSVWTIASEPYPEAHFATFPTEIPRLCILAGCKPGAKVLDIFAGSGTTLQVAMELGHDAVGIELNPEYVKLIHKRCALAAAQQRLF